MANYLLTICRKPLPSEEYCPDILNIKDQLFNDKF